jgi:hypothetical protein
MATRPRDDDREQRIDDEIIVDAYGPDEQALGWYYYLESHLHVPFTARCRKERAISPLHLGDEVDVVGMAPEEECEREMFVTLRWERRGLAVPLAQLEVIHADDATRLAVEDWHYWLDRGHAF